jgi:RimJ/RimL family protein N-acetyltransferase
MADEIPAVTIDVLARSIYKEASSYGFQQVDIIRLINELMDLCSGPDAIVDGQASGVARATPAGSPDRVERLPVEGEHVVIRSYDAGADAALLERWLPDKYGRYFVLSCATAQSITIDTLANGAGNHVGIVTLRDGQPIGAMAYLDHSTSQKRAELRKLIGDPDSRGKGLAEEATNLWVRYGADCLGLEKIYVSTLQTQIANIRLNESIGFRVEGLLRNEVCIDSVRHDVLRMGLTIEK